MHVTFVNRFFPPDISATSQILGELVYGLADRGLRIRVITSDCNYLGGKIKEYNDNIHPNIEVVRISSTSFGRKNLLYRYLDFISFLALSLQKIAIDKSDIIVFFTDPPLISYAGSFVTLLRHKKYIIVLQDFFPYTAINTGLIKNKFLFSLLDYQARYFLNNANAVVVLSEKMREFAENMGVKREKMSIIHNWSDGKSIYPIKKENSRFFKEWGVEGKFVILYSGNLGIGHEFDTILKVAKRFNYENDNSTLFLFIGEGLRRRYVEQYKRENGLKNVMVKDYVNKKYLCDSLAVADIHLITQINEVVGVNMPSKLYSCMASGRPILYIGSEESDVSRIIKDARSGFAFNIGQDEEIYKKIKYIRDKNDVLLDMGKNARDFFEKHFDKDIAIGKYHNLIESVYGK